ncbi:Uncharacterized SAM-binding protein YcdF, DUF218 family [Dyella sp. OK004]|uniref:YdcF family protein n=1 Tax=Dyella sp. OK004 TaxID=1855292 RepID=UPI0008ED8AA6|nr:YdcF family protein [Dyella sp. OK004]SFS08169.1 Uncharacterized SAM-binding protein YcdF, DUF218 family [Dyella sp. OK004]
MPSYFFNLSHPIAQALLLAGVGLLCVMARRYRTGLCVIALVPVWLTLCATPAFASALQRTLTNQYPAQAASTYPSADAIVILGGERDPQQARWDDEDADVAASRVGFGYLLFKAKRAPVVLLSGGEGDALRMAGMLEHQGVPVNALHVESRSRTTYENARNSAAILRQGEIHRILLVTSAEHMPRAVASFEKQGLEVIPAPAMMPLSKHPVRDLWAPRRAVLWNASQAMHEYIGLWVYRLRGWA